MIVDFPLILESGFGKNLAYTTNLS